MTGSDESLINLQFYLDDMIKRHLVFMMLVVERMEMENIWKFTLWILSTIFLRGGGSGVHDQGKNIKIHTILFNTVYSSY